MTSSRSITSLSTWPALVGSPTKTLESLGIHPEERALSAALLARVANLGQGFASPDRRLTQYAPHNVHHIAGPEIRTA